MADLLSLIYQSFYEWFVIPLQDYLLEWTNLDFETPVVITMPGSNTALLTTSLMEIITLAGGIFLFIGSIICFIGVLKLFYKIGRRLFGGRR